MNWSAPFEELEAGQAFTTRGRTVTEADVVGFAALTGDWHPQHTDAVWAAESAFGERIAHGLAVVSFAAGLVPFDGDRVMALRRVADATFKRPVKLGDTIRVKGKVAELSEISDEAGLVAFTWSVVNQDDRVVCRARVEVLWRRGDVAPTRRTPRRRASSSRSPCEADARRQEAPHHRRLNRESIAFEVARQAQLAGAEVLLTGFGRAKRMTDRSAARLPEPPDVLELDVNGPDDLAALADELRERWGRVDGVLHAIAFAPEDALGGNFLYDAARERHAGVPDQRVLVQGARRRAERPLSRRRARALVGMDFDAQVAWPVYDWMGVAKAALEAVNRYLARDLGPRGVRVNLVSAGPLGTLAARGIPGFSDLADAWQRQAPLGWDVEDPAPVAGAVLFLLSDWARGVTGEVLHVDGGFHAMGTALAPAGEAASERDPPPRSQQPEPGREANA